MIIGPNSLPFQVTNISGSGVTGISASNFSILGFVGANPITLTSFTEKSSGFYLANISLPQTGQGAIKIYSSNVNHLINPDFYTLDVDQYDSDNVYNKMVSIGTANIPQSAPNRFTVINLTVKQDSSIAETIQVPTIYSLASISGMSLKFYPVAKLTTASTPALSGTSTASVVSVSAGLVSIVVKNDLLQNLIPTGQSSTTIYGDINYIETVGGYEKRPVQLTVTVVRDF